MIIIELDKDYELKIDNDLLEEKQNQIIRNSDQLKNENNELERSLIRNKIKFRRIFKNQNTNYINNELKNTISRFIVDNKKLRENISLLENYKNSKIKDEINKINESYATFKTRQEQFFNKKTIKTSRKI